ncbi:hypothetical protein QQS21_009225 [Conoideocrella luteorostrata]|uniref:Uncharacterized protein n=1 Tax=Conoideocrella luteorostrata TaxID=1105319 RepID=A0AAJ0CK06_9HYPO|nr:hypothetical protein QQS21_009225 [Conoideocrella luteorostrata]
MDVMKEKNGSFRPATVGACHKQTAVDRFGPEAKRAIYDRERISLGLNPAGGEWPANWPGSDSDDGDDDVPATSVYKLVPSLQAYRNNLTALSQKYNLYFTAYRSRIFVYVPRGAPKQAIPRHPDLQLTPPRSDVCHLIRGYLDPDSPHSVNHMIVGSLGKEEIVVTCHDDGDVVAFYTKDIAEYILRISKIPSAATPRQRRSSNPSMHTWNTPKPFFLQNVGISAWGLAVHQKSRLIAVSSNRFEVTVFAFALATGGPGHSWTCDCMACCHYAEVQVRRRVRNWRIVVSLGHLADNIPNISFVDDKYGYAEKVSAIDIKGAIWLADIWRSYEATTRIMPSTSPLLKSEEFWPASSRGWGILVLAGHHFLKVNSEQELLGASLKDVEITPKLQGGPPPTVNMSNYIRNLPENPCAWSPPTTRHSQQNNANNPNPALAAVMSDDESIADQSSDDDEVLELGDTGQPSEGDEEEEEEEEDDDDEEEEEEDQEEDIASESNESEAEDDSEFGGDIMFHALPTGGVALGSGISPALTSQEGEATSMTSAVEQSVSASVLDETAPPDEVVDTPAIEAAQVLENLSEHSSDLHIPPSFTSSPGTDSQYAVYNPLPESASFSQCLKHAKPHVPPTLLNMIYTPHDGFIREEPRDTSSLARFLKRSTQYNENSQDYTSDPPNRFRRYHILRMYEKDLELRTFNKPDVGQQEYSILLPYALSMGLGPGRGIRPHFRATSRLSMVVHIPELYLVIVGSPIGRVVLVTPTCLSTPVAKSDSPLHHGIRLEWVLPRQSDEKVYRVLKRPLHGMAVGPVQEDGVMGGGDERKRVASPRRYRLMLHYRNHDILTYEISREEQTGKVCIF